MSSKARTLTKGSILRVIEFFATAVITLAMTPFIIRSLGDNMYGLWIFVGSFLGYYGLMDFGLNSAVQRFLSRAIGASDDRNANTVINTALCLFCILGILAFLLSISIAFLMPLFITNISHIAIFRIIVIILGLNFAIGFPLRIFSGILTAHIRYELSTIIELIKLLVRTVLIIIFLKRGYGVFALVFITFTMDIAGYLTRYVLVKRLYKSIIFSVKYFDISKVRELFSYSIYTSIAQLADQVRFNVDNLVIMSFIGSVAVTVYSIAFRLIKYFADFMTASLGIVVPIFSQYEAINDYEAIRKQLMFMTKINSYLSIFLGGIIIILGKVFIQRWVGVEYLHAYPILVVLAVSFTIAQMQGASRQLFYGINPMSLLLSLKIMMLSSLPFLYASHQLLSQSCVV